MFDGSDVSIINRDGLIIHPVCRPTGLYTGGRRSVIQALRYSFHLFPVLLKMKVDIIDCQNFPYFPVIVSRLIGFLKKEKCIITWHEAWGAYWYQYLGLSGIGGRVIEKIALLLSGSSIAVSHHTADRMRNEGYHGSPEIITNGITLQDIRKIAQDETTTDIIFIGRFIPEKHRELVVEPEVLIFGVILPGDPARTQGPAHCLDLPGVHLLLPRPGRPAGVEKGPQLARPVSLDPLDADQVLPAIVRGGADQRSGDR